MIDLQYFEYKHLPARLKNISKKFYDLAVDLNDTLEDCPQKTILAQKLLEAKDCAVRAALVNK